MSTTEGKRPNTRTFRPESVEDYDAAQEALHKRGFRIGDFLRACVAWVLTDPDAALKALAPHWPAPRPTGWRAHRARQQDSPQNPT